MKDKPQEESEIAEDILESVKLLTDGDTGRIYMHSDGVYRLLTKNEVQYCIITEYGDNGIRYTRNKRNVTLDFLKSKSHMNSEDIEESTKGTINLQNGVYYLDKTVEVFKVDNNNDKAWMEQSHFKYHPLSDYYSFNQIPVDYDPNATCPNIDNFISEVFGEQHVEEIYEFIGYILLPHVKYQRALIMVGSGRNGKTTFLDMIIHFIGENNISQTPLQSLDSDFAMINLKNIMLNVVGDLPSKPLDDTGNAKRIVTDKTLSGNIKNVQGIFNFNNRCKMAYACNDLPRTKDKTPAFYRRWLMKICDAVFEGDNQDINISDKITTPEEMSGLFNRALEGIERLKKNHGFKNTEREVKDLWELETNPIGDFINVGCNIIVGNETKSKDLFDAFNRYRADKGLSLFDFRKTGYWLRQYGIIGVRRPDKEDIDKYGNAKWYTFYQDIELKKKPTKKTEVLDIWAE